MSTAAFNKIVETFFASRWGNTTSVRYDSVPFKIPKTAWVSLEVWDGKSNKGSLGTGAQLRRNNGTIFVSVFAPINKGSKEARTLCDTVCGIFRDANLNTSIPNWWSPTFTTTPNVIFEEPDVVRLGEVTYSSAGSASGTSQWYQMKVAIPFIFDVYI